MKHKTKSRNVLPDVHTPAGFRALLAYPEAIINEVGGTHIFDALNHLLDAIMLTRVKMVKYDCVKCQKARPAEWWHLGKMGETDICSLSCSASKMLYLLIKHLVETFKKNDLPPVYPDLISLLQQIQEQLDTFANGMEREQRE